MLDFPLSAIGYSLLINDITNNFRVCSYCPHHNGECIDFASKGQCKALPSDISRYTELNDDICVNVVDTKKGVIAAKFYSLPSEIYTEQRYRYTTYCRLTRDELRLSSEVSDEEYYNLRDKYVTEFIVPLSALKAFVHEYDGYDNINDFNNNWTWDDAETLYNFCRWNKNEPIKVIKEVTKEKCERNQKVSSKPT